MSAVWLSGFLLVSLSAPGLTMIQFTDASVFLLTLLVGIVMIGSTQKCGRLALFLGVLNIIWVLYTVFLVYVLQTGQLAAYVFAHIIRLVSAAGTVQLFLREQKREAERGLAHMQYQSDHDELTGLHNKYFFDNMIESLNREEDCLPVSLLFGDMNGLKAVNDIFGHLEGNRWIERMAFLLRTVCREKDIVARWGGDEFAVILLRTDQKQAAAAAERIMHACENEQESGILLSISLGFATKSDETADLSEVLKEAESAMYKRS